MQLVAGHGPPIKKPKAQDPIPVGCRGGLPFGRCPPRSRAFVSNNKPLLLMTSSKSKLVDSWFLESQTFFFKLTSRCLTIRATTFFWPPGPGCLSKSCSTLFSTPRPLLESQDLGCPRSGYHVRLPKVFVSQPSPRHERPVTVIWRFGDRPPRILWDGPPRSISSSKPIGGKLLSARLKVFNVQERCFGGVGLLICWFAHSARRLGWTSTRVTIWAAPRCMRLPALATSTPAVRPSCLRLRSVEGITARILASLRKGL